MIVVCSCGQKNRVNDFTVIERLRCAGCKQMLHTEVIQQAARNANIVLELAAYLYAKPVLDWTPEEEIVARIIQAHQK